MPKLMDPAFKTPTSGMQNASSFTQLYNTAPLPLIFKVVCPSTHPTLHTSEKSFENGDLVDDSWHFAVFCAVTRQKHVNIPAKKEAFILF